MSKYYLTQEDYLMHHGVKGQKWGQRQYQNEDGSLTALGREHYGYGQARDRLSSAKTNLRNLEGRQYKRDAFYGNLGRITKTGRQLSRDIKDARKEYREAKRDYKIAKKETKRDEDVKAVSEYNKAFNKLDKVGNKLDELWEQGKQGSKEYQKLSAKFDSLSAESKAAYKKTGRNFVERVRNVSKYSKTPEKLTANKSDSSVTKKVKSDYNNLTDGEFKRKYATTKDVYAKRVEKYGDPYMNSPAAKIGKAIQNEANRNAQRYWSKKK